MFGMLLVTIFTLLAARLIYLVVRARLPCKRSSQNVAMVILGSGGHTAEMLRLLSGMNLKNFPHRVYVMADGDQMSLSKISAFEHIQGNRQPAIKIIPRARKVLQSYITAILSTLIAIIYSFPLVVSTLPDVILCNGPGTCIPLCFWCFVMKFFWVKDTKIVYVESICRVHTLSLSALILYFVADHLLVQWPQLKTAYPRTEYIGRII